MAALHPRKLFPQARSRDHHHRATIARAYPNSGSVSSRRNRPGLWSRQSQDRTVRTAKPELQWQSFPDPPPAVDRFLPGVLRSPGETNFSQHWSPRCAVCPLPDNRYRLSCKFGDGELQPTPGSRRIMNPIRKAPAVYWVNPFSPLGPSNGHRIYAAWRCRHPANSHSIPEKQIQLCVPKRIRAASSDIRTAAILANAGVANSP